MNALDALSAILGSALAAPANASGSSDSLLAAMAEGAGTTIAGAPVALGSIALGPMAMGLFGGLALFLFGIDQMTEGLKAAAGDRMRAILEKLTANRVIGAVTGALVTAIIQSSSVTTVLVVGFTTAGLMSFTQSIAIIMGANVGTTITAQIVAFQVTEAALVMIALGFSLLFFWKNGPLRHYGGMLMGLGLVFFGMGIMSDAMQPLRSYEPFLDLMVRMENPLVGILVAAAFTALIQSSSATTAIVIVMAGQGFITLPAGIALAFGANIGTCATALLASIGKPREAVRAATAHVVFNIAGVLLWLGFIDQLATLVTALSPQAPDLTGTVRRAAEAPRQIANAHTIFNVANTLVFLWFTPQIARLVSWLVPDRPAVDEEGLKPKFLDEALLAAPALALANVRLEIRHMGERVEEMLAEVMPATLHGDSSTLNQLKHKDDDVDELHAAIVTYLGKISALELTASQTSELLSLMNAVNDLENIGDVIEINLVELGQRRIDRRVAISPGTRKVLTDLHDAVRQAVAAAIGAVADNDLEAAKAVIRLKKAIRTQINSAALHESQRLVAREPNRIEAYTIEMDITEKLQRIFFFARRMARTVA